MDKRAAAMREAAEESYGSRPWTMAFEGRDPTIATAGADAELARVVAWLREWEFSERARIFADAIERGEHWRDA
jgi:hypothetical protein